MSITRNFQESIAEKSQQDSKFAEALFDEAISLLLEGETKTARLILRDLVNATIGFEKLADKIALPSKSLHRMLSAAGNPTMNNIALILTALRQELKVDIEVKVLSTR